jgi:uncharacterized protein YbaA (DUF1428 family)
MAYVDGFLLPVPEKNLAVYRKMARLAGKVWREHGALDYRECVLDDARVPGTLAFPDLMKLKRGEVAVFSWILYESRAARNRINKLVMKDKRMNEMMKKGAPMPFDMKRMCYGGFKSIVAV